VVTEEVANAGVVEEFEEGALVGEFVAVGFRHAGVFLASDWVGAAGVLSF
jgi:hypothetical protein